MKRTIIGLLASLLLPCHAHALVDHVPVMVRVQTELIELSHKDLSKLLMEDKSEVYDASPMRIKVQKLVDKDQAKIIDTQVISCRSGEMATKESISEFIYPTEYESIPYSAEDDEESKPIKPTIPPLPLAFETRNIGSTLEVEPTMGENRKMVNLRFCPELVWHTGNTSWQEYKDEKGNVHRVEMPDFYTLRVNTAQTCLSGQYSLAAVLSPKDDKGRVDTDRKIMLFVKCTVLAVKNQEL